MCPATAKSASFARLRRDLALRYGNTLRYNNIPSDDNTLRYGSELGYGSIHCNGNTLRYGSALRYSSIPGDYVTSSVG